MISDEKREKIIQNIIEKSNGNYMFDYDHILDVLEIDKEEWLDSEDDSKYWDLLKELIEPREVNKLAEEHEGTEELNYFHDKYYNDIALVYKMVFKECPTLFDNEKLLNELDKRLMPEDMVYPKAADGLPIKPGDNLYMIDDSSWEANAIFKKSCREPFKVVYLFDEYSRIVVDSADGATWFIIPRTVTHTQLDSWEKYEEKLTDLLGDGELAHTMTSRAKELAEGNQDVG